MTGQWKMVRRPPVAHPCYNNNFKHRKNKYWNIYRYISCHSFGKNPEAKKSHDKSCYVSVHTPDSNH